MHGSDDRLASVNATQRIFDRLISPDKELVIYPGFYHELFNEPEKQTVFERVSEWLDKRSLPV
jgi:lysophospholipase